ncbi:ABC transporter ATP-binding protein [Corynebacterium cystitidis]|uniref:ABC transporter ATP-binding protein n=1 Tax=Corynebacterium cystitidis TaxID=35757 RepID=UPI00211E0474|nr:ABC transporter ATP-binding protein [Corynebacterium cystitidis]
MVPIAPDGIVVEDLVSRGRYSYHTMMRQWSSQDQQALEWAMERANVAQLKDRPVAALSGGQRQRVWLAMVLAQQTLIVLLDEPTTFLDITHQDEVLDLAAGLYEAGSTVVAVLHELTLAFRYATHVIVMKAGEIVAQGSVKDVVTAQLLEEVYEIACDVIADPRTGKPIVIPRTSRFRRAAATTPSA